MANFIKNRWALFLVLAVFIAFKIPHLFYPYYWDESWPYAVAIKEMYIHGISLMPTALDPELSRGHPLFFHAIAAMWMSVFGPSLVSMHSFALTISVLFLIAIYEVGLKLFNQRVATMALCLVATLVVFFVQSSFVLFEMLIAFLCFLSIAFYTLNKHVLTAVCLTAVFYTKESGLMVGFLLGIDALISLFNKQYDWKVRMYKLLSVGVPCILIGVFFLLQKHIRGWYIFPLYNDIIEHRWGNIWYNFRINGLHTTFTYDSKYLHFVILLLVVLIGAIKKRSVKYLAPVPVAILLFLLVDDRRGGEVMFSGLLLTLLVLSIVYMFYLFQNIKLYDNKRQEQFVVLCGTFVFLFICFSSLNFFTYRYLLAALIPLFFFVAVVINQYLDRSYPVLFYPVLLLLLGASTYSFCMNDSYGDSDLGAFKGMDVQQQEVDFLLKHYPDSTYIGCGSFLSRQHLIDPASGFLHGAPAFKHVKWEFDENTQIIVFGSIETDYRYDEKRKDTVHFKRQFRYQQGPIWTEIYKVVR